MKKKSTHNLLIFFILFSILHQSCSIENRKYMSGFHIESRINTNYQTKKVKEDYAENKREKKSISISQKIAENYFKEQPSDKIESTINTLASIKKEFVAKNGKIIKSPSNDWKYNLNTNHIFSQKKTRSSYINLIRTEADKQTPGMATASFVLGILALVSYYGAFLFGLLALIFGSIALKKIRNEPDKYKGKGMAMAGYICGLVSMALIALILLL